MASQNFKLISLCSVLYAVYTVLINQKHNGGVVSIDLSVHVFQFRNWTNFNWTLFCRGYIKSYRENAIIVSTIQV